MTAFVRADPPPRWNDPTSANPVYIEFAQFLRDNPGDFYLWPNKFATKNRASNHAANIRRGLYPAFRGNYEATARDGQVYVRYVGDRDE